MYQALYRKWRPQTFDAVIGQKHITETLKNQVKTGRLSHAYIFIGTRGTGKTTCARILAKAVNCEHPVNGNPCCECDACRSIADGSAVDIVELDAASNNGVDNVRALREEAIFSPTTVRKRVYIIDEVHMLSTSAFNALLKILEEPPEHLMFILATTELQKVPATILSRCQRHSFKRLEPQIISRYLQYIAQQEQFELTEDAANLVARLSDGGVRDSLSLLDQCSGAGKVDVDVVYNTLGLAGNRRTSQLLDCIVRHDTESAVTNFNSLWMDGKDPSTILTELCTLLRDTLITQVAPKTSSSLVSGTFDMNILHEFRTKLTAEEIMAGMDNIQNTLSELKNAANPKMASEICIISLCNSLMGESIKELKARISRLEQQVKNGAVITSTRRNAPVVEDEPERYEEYPGDEDTPPMPDDSDIPPYDEEPYQAHFDPEPQIAVNNEPRYPEHVEERTPDNRENSLPEQFKKQKIDTAPEIHESSCETSDINVTEIYPAVKEEALRSLPKNLAVLFENENEVCGHFDGAVLRIEVVQGFLLGMIGRPNVVGMLETIASRTAGKPVKVTVSQMAEKKTEVRSMDELTKFKEVTVY